MQYARKGKRAAVGVTSAIMLFAAAIMAGAQGSETSLPASDEVGMIQLALVTPIDVDYIAIDLYRGADPSAELVDNVTLASGVYSVVFPELLQDAYFITAKAFDGNGTLIYQGTGSASVVSEVTSILTILLNQKAVENASNRAPRIDSFEAFGRTTEGVGGLYVLAPNKNEPVQLTAAVSDEDGDTPSVRWAVTDSPSPGGVVVGTILSDSMGSSIIWKHDEEGTYWVNVFADDGKGGAAAFAFSITVLNNKDDLDVRFFFNAFPTVVTSVRNERASKSKLARKTIILDATGSADPDGDRVSYLWTTDCAFAEMTSAVTAEKVAIVATKEETCTATVHVFDTLGYNEATVALDICCREGNKNCGVCSPSQQRIRPVKADLRLSKRTDVKGKLAGNVCFDEPSEAPKADAPAAAVSQTNTSGMCRL
jgi:hypothetical protein